MIKLWCLFTFLFGLLIGSAASQGLWDLGSSEDWLSVGPIYHAGPYYYPNSDLPIGFQNYLMPYPSYPPVYYSSYYPNYPINYTYNYPYYHPYYYNFDHFPLGTFGERRGGNYY